MEEFYIGQKFYTVYPPEAAFWCNTNNAMMTEVKEGDGSHYYQIIEVPTHEPTYEEIRQARQSRYTAEADPIRYNYDEALARGEETAEALKQEWLAKKDEIRADLPYPDEESYSG